MFDNPNHSLQSHSHLTLEEAIFVIKGSSSSSNSNLQNGCGMEIKCPIQSRAPPCRGLERWVSVSQATKWCMK